MSPSLRDRLSRGVLVTMAPVLAGLAILLFVTVRAVVWDAFDQRLESDARTYASMLQYDAEGYEFELGTMADTALGSPGSAGLLRLWLPDGTPVAGVQALEGIGQGATPGAHDATLPDGRVVRFVVHRFPVQVDPEDLEDAGILAPPGQARLVFARETRSTRALLDRLLVWFLGLGLVTLAVVGWAARRAVARGLRPMDRLASDITAISVEGSTARIAEAGMPRELAQVVQALNGLLKRVDAGLARERRFTAGAAHELRTPLTLLRTSAQLALRRARDPDADAEALRDCLEASRQMSERVDALLSLVRLEGEARPLRAEPLELAAVVDDAWEAHRDLASSRGLTFENHLPRDDKLRTDRGLWSLIVSNLLANAAAYTQRGGWIRVDSSGPETVLRVANSGPPIPEGDLPQLFEPFWRADAARSDSASHVGLGLALCRAAVDRLGCQLRVENCADGEVWFSVRRSPH